MGFLISHKSKPMKPRETVIQKLIKTMKAVTLVCSLTFFPLLIAHNYPFLKFAFFEVTPGFLRSVRNFLTPLSLFLVLNMIIIFVAVTSYHQEGVKGHGDAEAKSKLRLQKSDENVCVNEISGKMPPGVAGQGDNASIYSDSLSPSTEEPLVILPESDDDSRDSYYTVKESLDQVPLLSRGKDMVPLEAPIYTPVPREAPVLADGSNKAEPPDVSVSREWNQLVERQELPLPATRFTHRKYIKGNSEMKPLGISRQIKKAETLEATWRSICEGRYRPTTRRLRKSETLNSSTSPSLPPSTLPKIETFRIGSASPSLYRHQQAGMDSPLRIPRREPSMSQQELNRKVEEFISNFNEQIRLERQESLLRYTGSADKSSA